MLTKWIISIFFTVILTFVFCFSSFGQEARKVAVLYFTDHSGFDRASGCGCLSLGPLNFIFGSGQPRERWELKSGFRSLLNESLKKAGYNIVEPNYVDKILQDTGKQNMVTLASRLDADIMVIGDITKFEQHRTRASSYGPTRASAEGVKMNLMGGIGGFRYASAVKTIVTIYDNTGDEFERAEIDSKKDLQDFSMGIGPLSKSYQGGSVKNKDEESQEPIVDYRKLDTIKFGTDEFKNRTLFGMATMDVMDKIVAKIREHVEPSVVPNVRGKIIYIGDGTHLKENEVYIDLGAGDGLIPGHHLGVYIESLTITDPDTGKELSKVAERKVGLIKVSKVEADHLSVAEIIEGIGEIRKGNIVK